MAEAVARRCHSLSTLLWDCLLIPADRALGGAFDMLFSCAPETRLLNLPGCSSGQAEVESLRQPAMSHTWLQGSFYLLTAAGEISPAAVSRLLTVPTTVLTGFQQVSVGLVGKG